MIANTIHVNEKRPMRNPIRGILLVSTPLAALATLATWWAIQDGRPGDLFLALACVGLGAGAALIPRRAR